MMIPGMLRGQSYNTTLGVRWGDGIGITARQRLLKRTSAEGIFYKYHKEDFTIAGVLLDHHMPVLGKRLNLYAGGGISRIFPQEKEDVLTKPYNAVLINAGLEITLARINASWDFMPVIPLSDENDALTTMTAFSLRYVLIKKEKTGLFKNDKSKQKHKHNARKRHKRKKSGKV